jgi:hypothetical protein
MTNDEFMIHLEQTGFPEPILITREADLFLDIHTHSFDAKALILQGEISITSSGGSNTYRVGDMFHVPAMTQHSEKYGPLGVKYLASRREVEITITNKV